MMSNSVFAKGIIPGVFVLYMPKNELGLVGSIAYNGALCWYHLGGTKAMTPYNLLTHLSFDQMIPMTFTNEYAKASLIERYYRLQEGGDVSDLIDERHLRPILIDLLKTLREVV